MTSKQVLLAVAPIPPSPIDNGYSLRVSGILGELTRFWDTVLVAPRFATGDTTGLEERLIEYVPVDLGGCVATMPWELDIETLKMAVNDVVDRWHPVAALLWAGTETLGFQPEFVPAVADRIDSAALASLRMTNSRGSLIRRLRRSARAARYERQVVRRMFATVVVGEDDARMLRSVSGRTSVHVIPNGVAQGPIPDPNWEDDVPTVIFTGVMNFHPNSDAAISFARNVWPLVLESVPTARFVIAGRNPRESVMELGRMSGVTVLPDVPDLQSEQRRAWIAVAPMRAGCGIKNKILEAWACGKPVVMSSMAANGLAEGHDEAGAIADSPGQVADEVVRLLRDRSERQRQGLNGYRLVAEHHSWAGAAARMSELLELAGGGSPRLATSGVVGGSEADSFSR